MPSGRQLDEGQTAQVSECRAKFHLSYAERETARRRSNCSSKRAQSRTTIKSHNPKGCGILAHRSGFFVPTTNRTNRTPHRWQKTKNNKSANLFSVRAKLSLYLWAIIYIYGEHAKPQNGIQNAYLQRITPPYNAM